MVVTVLVGDNSNKGESSPGNDMVCGALVGDNSNMGEGAFSCSLTNIFIID
jgi:hypothetical protein